MTSPPPPATARPGTSAVGALDGAAEPAGAHAAPPAVTRSSAPRPRRRRRPAASAAGWRPWRPRPGGAGRHPGAAAGRGHRQRRRDPAVRPRGRPGVPVRRRRPGPGRPRTPTSSCGSRPSRPTSSRRMPTPPTPSSSAAWSRRPSARTTPAAIASASRLIAEAAQHQPADGAALGALNQALVTYTSQVEQARANNRQALPVGAQYLRSASADLRADALPAAEEPGARPTTPASPRSSTAPHGRPCGSSSPACSPWLVLGLALVWLARRTRRYVNVPLGGRGAGGAGDPGGRRGRARWRSSRTSTPPATASTPPRCPRPRPASPGSTPSPTRASRSSPAAPAQRSRRPGRPRTPPSSAELTELGQNPASSGLSPLPWSEYAARPRADPHARRLRRLGRCGRSSPPAPGPSTGNATFAAFDTSSDEQLAALSGQTSQQLDDAGGWLPVAGALGRAGGRGRRRSAPGGASRCGWRSTDEPPPTAHARRPRRGGREPGRRGLHDGRRLRPDTPVHPVRVAVTVAVAAARTATPSPAPSGTDVATTNCLQSYAPPATLPTPGPDAVGQLHEHDPGARPPHRGRLGRHAAARRPQPGLGARSRASTSTCCARSPRPSSAPRQDRAAGHHRGPARCQPSRTAASTSSRAT